MRQSKEANSMNEKTISLLVDIKKLAILDLITHGVQGKDIAQVVDKSTITRIVPARKIKVNRTDEEI